jgi:hypothetical protein
MLGLADDAELAQGAGAIEGLHWFAVAIAHGVDVHRLAQPMQHVLGRRSKNRRLMPLWHSSALKVSPAIPAPKISTHASASLMIADHGLPDRSAVNRLAGPSLAV